MFAFGVKWVLKVIVYLNCCKKPTIEYYTMQMIRKTNPICNQNRPFRMNQIKRKTNQFTKIQPIKP